MMNATLRGKPDAGNPHVRFDEGEVASAKPRRGSLLYKINKMVVGLIAVLVSAAQMVASGEEAQESVARPLTVQIGGRTYYNRAAMTPAQLNDMRAHDATIPVKLCDAKAASAPGYPRQGSARNCCEYISKATFTKLETGEMKIAITVSVPGILSFDDTTVYWDHGLISTKGEYSEHIHVWIDWNGDKKWSASEMVMASSQKDYRALSNNKTLNFSKTVKIPSGAVGETYARILLAWGDNISDPEASSWMWGDVTDKIVYPSPEYGEPEIVEISARPASANLVSADGSGQKEIYGIMGEEVSFDVTVEFPKGQVQLSDHYEFTGHLATFFEDEITIGAGSIDTTKRNVDRVKFPFRVKIKDHLNVNQLGKQEFKVIYKKCDQATCGLEKTKKGWISIFFNKTAMSDKNEGLNNILVPNWAYYWKEMKVVSSFKDDKSLQILYATRYENQPVSCGMFHAAFPKRILIGNDAVGTDGPYTMTNSGNADKKFTIPRSVNAELLEKTIVHEKTHKKHYDDGWRSQKPDSDNDYIPDAIETDKDHEMYLLDIHDPDTYRLGTKFNNNEYRAHGDEEFLCRITEKEDVSRKINHDRDWSHTSKRYVKISGAANQSVQETSGSETGVIPEISLVSNSVGIVRNENDLIEDVVVRTTVRVAGDGDLEKLILTSTMYAQSSTVVAAYDERLILSNGVCTIKSTFKGSDISNSKLTGPYKISVTLSAMISRDPISCFSTEFDVDWLSVDSFAPVDVMIVAADISDSSSSDGIALKIPLIVHCAGSYRVSATLFETNAGSVATAVAERRFEKGNNTCSLLFSADDLYKSRMQGNVSFENIKVERDSDIVSQVGEITSQNIYEYDDFRKDRNIIQINHRSVVTETYGVDLSGNVKALRVLVDVENKQPSPTLYNFSTALANKNGDIVATVSQNVQLPLLTNSVALYFSGVDISSSGIEGPYELRRISVCDLNTSEEIDAYNGVIDIGEYGLEQFTPKPFTVNVSNITSSVVLNSDGGKIKSLNVSVPMMLNTEGEVTISGTLVDANGNYVAHASLTEYRLAGVASFVLPFQGGDIFASGLNGPYRIVNLCVSHSSEPDYTYEEVTNSMVTEAYKYDDFLPLSELYGNIPTEGLVYQLDASNPHSITTNESSEVLEWFSTDGLIRFATDDESGARPFYVPTAFGGKGGILFGSNPVTKAVGSSRMATTTDTDNQTVFIVTKPNGSQNNYGGVWGSDGSSIGFSTGTSTWYPYGFAANGALYKDGTIAHGEAPMDLNAAQVVTVVSGTIQNFATAIGNFYNSADYPARFYKGEIAEILVYDRVLTDVERLTVEAFLQKKWISEAKTLFAVPESQMLLSDAQTTNVVVVGLTDWAASVDCQWLHLLDGKGSGTANLNFSVDENPSGVSRTATITITNATTSTKCLVTQYFKDYVDTDINFADPVTIAGDSDVVTEGTLVAAYCGSYPRTVNGVAFTSSRGTTFGAKNWWSGGNYSGGTAAPWANLSQNYRYILQSAFGTQTLYINNLEVGQTYLVQLWSNNSTSNGVNGRMSVVSGKHSVSIKQNSTGAYGGVGQYTIGYFVADRATKEIYMSGNYLFNAIQLRKISALPTSRIEITDSVKSFIDRTVDFGDVMAGLSKRESITVKNNSATANLAITGIRTSFREDFNDGTAKYWKPDSEDNWAVVNGAYRAQNASIDSQMFSIYSGGDIADVAVQFDCWREGGTTYSEGVALRATPGFNASSGSGYMFFITTDGSFSVWKVVNGISTALKSWTASSALTSTTNTVIASAKGSTLALFINGKRVWKGTDSEISRGRIGLGGYTTSVAPTTHYFDNVIQGAPIPTDSTLEESLHVAESVAGSPWIAPNQVAEEDPVGAGEVQTPVSVGEPVFRVASDADFPVVIAPGGSQTFEIDFAPATLGATSSSATIFTDDATEEMLSVELRGRGISDYLTLCTDSSSQRFSGHPGGPFAPEVASYVITNSGALTCEWTFSAPEWLTPSVSSGVLAGFGSVTVNASVNGKGASKPEGVYEGYVSVSNRLTGLGYAKKVYLDVKTSPKMEVSPGCIVVTNRIGQTQAVKIRIANAASADANLMATIDAYETGRELAENAAQSGLMAASAKKEFRIPKGVEFRDRDVIVRFDQNANTVSAQENVLAAIGGRVIRRYKLVPGLALVRIPEAVATSEKMEALVQRINGMRGISYAHPNYTQKAIAVPNDELFGQLWGLNNSGQTGGTPGCDIAAVEAWNRTTGNKSVIVGVVDSGVDYTHEDLKDNMWINEGEIPGDGIDNDGNGVIDDVYGYNSIEDTGDPMDDHKHGTHCAGTIAASGNNGRGVVGVCWNARIMALKFLDSTGNGDTANAISCIEYAVLNGAKILSNSWGGGAYSTALKEMIDAAGDAGILFVAAAGNDYGVNNDLEPHYPSSYACKNILSVMSTDHNDKRSDFSNFGLNSVHIGAPGTDILSCRVGGGYLTLSGTSMATPHVSGAAALLLSVNQSLSPAQLKEILMNSGDPVLEGQCASGRRLNIGRALNMTSIWLSVDKSRIDGLEPGRAAEVAVSCEGGFCSAGTYDGIIRIAGNDLAMPETNVTVRMVVIPDELRISPDETFSVTGNEGGPFTPSTKTYVLYNADVRPIAWSCESSDGWVSFSPSSGLIPPGGRQEVVVSIDGDAAADLPAGVHVGNMLFRNGTSGVVQRRFVSIAAKNYAGVLYVDPSRPDDSGSGRTWRSAKRTLQSAVAKAMDGTTIIVADGTYDPIETHDVRMVIQSVNGPRTTVIDGRGKRRCATLGDRSWINGEYRYSTNVTLVGFTLRNGLANTSSPGSYYGGGAYCGVLSNCVVVANKATYGGGVYGCEVYNSLLESNQAISYGGATGYSLLSACHVLRNKAVYGAGSYYGSAQNCVYHGNTATSYGGGAYYGALTGCSVSGNNTRNYGGAGTYYSVLTNSIVWGNTRTESHYVNNCDMGSACYSCIQDPDTYYNGRITLGANCITSDPLFLDEAGGVLMLRSGSPCLNSGLTSAASGLYDISGSPRVQGSAVDFGAYEGVRSGYLVKSKVEGPGIVCEPFVHVASGGSAMFSVIEIGRKFVCWKIGGSVVSTNPVYVWSDIRSNGEITAVFEHRDLYVDAHRPNDNADGFSWESAKRTINAAVDGSFPGETIWVTNGVYEGVTTEAKSIFIRSVNGAAVTCIDGGGTNRCAMLGVTSGSNTVGEGTRLSGFTLQNGYSTAGGGGSYYGVIENCIIKNCRSEQNGGGAFYSVVSNSVLSCNTAMGYGGGMYYGTSVGCSIVGNKAGNGSGGTYYGTHYNGVVFANSRISGEVDNSTGGTMAYCCTYPSRSGSSMVIGDPGLVDPYNGDARLRVGSLCIDKGRNEFVAGEYDVAKNPRIQGTRVDIGAYEGNPVAGFVISGRIEGNGSMTTMTSVVEPGGSATFTAVENGRRFLGFATNGVFATSDKVFTWSGIVSDGIITALFENRTYYVDASKADDSGDGFSWETAKKSLQVAIDLAMDGEVVKVAKGVYPPIQSENKRILIEGVEGPTQTIIDGGGVQRCATLGSSTAHILTRIEGFKLTNGRATSGGGVMYGTLSNCVITANVATGTSYAYGGGTYYSTLYACEISNNNAEGTYGAYGAGVYYGSANNCRIIRNRAFAPNYVYGGGAYYGTHVNCLIAENRASCTRTGGVIGGGTYYGTLRNCTVANNIASVGTVSAGTYYGSLYNCIVWGNADENGQAVNHPGQTMYYSCTTPAANGTRNIAADPLFADAEHGDYRLSLDSPCLNAGLNSYVIGMVDLLGAVRIQDGVVDLGAYEGGVYTQVPGAVSDLMAASGRVSWSPADMASAYKIYRGENMQFANARLIATVSTTYYTDASAQYGVPYWYWVCAENPVGMGPLSNAAQNSWPDPLEITTSELPFAVENETYSRQLSATGGTPPYTWICSNGYVMQELTGSTFASGGEPQGWKSDDQCWVYELPFQFAFYGKRYDRVYVSSNGTISFGEMFSNWSASVSNLAGHSIVAGCFADLTTSNDGDDIYVCEQENEVIFRWHARYLSGGLPVNFQIALNKNGQIRISYGEGAAQGGLVGVSCGDGEEYTLASVGQGDSLEYANDLIFAPSNLPEGLTMQPNGLLSGKPKAAGVFPVTVWLEDSIGILTNREYELRVVANPNTRPVVESISPASELTQVFAGSKQKFEVTAYDPEGKDLTFVWSVDGVRKSGTGASFTYMPSVSDYGYHTIRCIVSDGFWTADVFCEWDVRVAKSFYVDASAPIGGDGSSPTLAFNSLSMALTRIADGDELILAPGTYSATWLYSKIVTIRSMSGPDVTFIDGNEGSYCVYGAWNSETRAKVIGVTLQNASCGAAWVDLENCIIRDCMSQIANGVGLVNCLAYHNKYVGDGLYDCEVYNSTISGNEGDYALGWGTVAYNSIISGNFTLDGRESNLYPYDQWVSYSDTNGWYSVLMSNTVNFCCSDVLPHNGGVGNIASDPRLVDAVHGDLRLRLGSPCRNVASVEYLCSDVDIAGVNRVLDGAPDMGAYEGTAVEGFVLSTRILGAGSVVPENAIVEGGASVAFEVVSDERPFLCFETNGVFATTNPTFTWSDVREDGIVTAVFSNFTYYVDSVNGDDGNDGLSWGMAKATIQAAVDESVDGETIWVADGVYGSIETQNKKIRIESINGAGRTIIDGGYPFVTNRCATLSINYSGTNTALVGFTLRNGFEYEGAGAFGGTLHNCIITGNRAECVGGGISASIAYDCLIASNRVEGITEIDEYGYPLYRYSEQYGGGACDAILYRCRVEDNAVIGSLGAYRVQGGGVSMSVAYDCLIVRNGIWAQMSEMYGGVDAYGGGMCSGEAYNCTIAFNTIEVDGELEDYPYYYMDGAGVSECNYGPFNCIIYSNLANGETNDVGRYYSPYYSEQANLIGVDPLFVDAEQGDYRLSEGSPAIDMGYDEWAWSPFDLGGSVRVQGKTIDLGAYESECSIYLAKQEVVVGAGAQSLAIGCRLAVGWIATTSDDWIDIAESPLEISEFGLSQFHFAVTSNESVEERIGRITFTCNGKVQTLQVRQLTKVEPPTRREKFYGLFVGVNRYTYANTLNGCVADATDMLEQCTTHGYWQPENCTILTDDNATKEGIRNGLRQMAEIAVAGDTVLYFQSSHGGNMYDEYGQFTDDVCLCAHDEEYYDYELAEDLSAFASGVKLVVMIDACHSGGLFKMLDANSEEAAVRVAVNIGERIQSLMLAKRKAKALTAKAMSTIDPSEIGWLTAADSSQYSYDSPDGGEFTQSALEGWHSGEADGEGYGDGDGYVTFYEIFNYAKDFATGDGDTEPQCLNEEVLIRTIAGIPDDSDIKLTPDLADALDCETLLWESDKPNAWVVVDDCSHDGEDSARSAIIGNTQSSVLRATTEGTGELRFWWKVSSEANKDWLRFALDGVGLYSVSGEQDWRQVVVKVEGSGPHEFVWTYAKGKSGQAGDDCGWVDCVEWIPDEVKTISLAEALGASNVTWQTEGDADWYGVRAGAETFAQSGVITDDESSILCANVTGPGELSFRWRVSCEEYDEIDFKVDGAIVRWISGETDWMTVTVALDAGSHHIEWEYWKDESDSEGDDCAYINQVVWQSSAPITADPIPDIGDEPTPEQVQGALAGSEDVRLFENIVDGNNYNAYRAWADEVELASGGKAGKQAVKDSPNAWLSFALDSATLIQTPPTDGDVKVEKFEQTATAGSFDFTVGVENIPVGDDATPGNLAKVFGIEGGSTLSPQDMSVDKVDITFGAPENGKVKFTAGPKDKTQPTFFMKVKIK